MNGRDPSSVVQFLGRLILAIFLRSAAFSADQQLHQLDNFWVLIVAMGADGVKPPEREIRKRVREVYSEEALGNLVGKIDNEDSIRN